MCHSVWFHNVIYLSFDVCTLCVFNAFGSYLTHPVFMGICCRLFVLMDKSFEENILTVAHFISKQCVCVCERAVFLKVEWHQHALLMSTGMVLSASGSRSFSNVSMTK